MKKFFIVIPLLAASQTLWAAGPNVDIEADTKAFGGSVVSVTATAEFGSGGVSIKTGGTQETLTTVGSVHVSGSSTVRGHFRSDTRAESFVNVGTEAHIGSLVVKEK